MVAFEAELGEGLFTVWADGDRGVFFPGYDGLLQCSALITEAGNRLDEAAVGAGVRGWRADEELCELRQALLETGDFEVCPVDCSPADFGKVFSVVPDEALVVVVAFTAFIARFAHPAPEAADGLVLGGAGELDLVHCVFLAEQPAAFSAVDTAVEGAEGPPTDGVETVVVACGALPVGSGDGEVRISFFGGRAAEFDDGGEGGPGGDGDGGVVGFEDVEAFELLVEDGDGLEGFGFEHAFAEPGAYIVFFDFFDFFVDVVEVAAGGWVSAFCGFTEGGGEEGGGYRFSWSNVTISSEHMGQTRRSPVLAAAGLPTRTPSPSLTDPKSEFSETELALGDRRPLPMADTAGERLRRPVAALPRTRPPPGGRELTGFMAAGGVLWGAVGGGGGICGALGGGGFTSQCSC